MNEFLKCGHTHKSSMSSRGGSCSSNPHPIRSYENDSSGSKGMDMLGIDEDIFPDSAPSPMSMETPSQKEEEPKFEEMSGCVGIEALFNAFEEASEFRRLST